MTGLQLSAGARAALITPDTGETKMPAIPPPGTPGGDLNVRPQ